jgi:hypothetical protein
MAVNTSNLIPTIGASGIWTLLPPFDALLTQSVSYNCLAVRQLEDIIAAGGDPYQQFYVPQEGSTAGSMLDQYNADLANKVCIVTLQSSSGAVVHVPTSFIQTFPSSGGVPYTNLLLGVDLGAMPDYVDLTFLKQQVANLVKTTVGLTHVQITTVVVSPTTHLSLSDHQVAEAARQANITNTVTPEAKVIALTQQLQASQQAYAALEAFLNANIGKLTGNPTPPTPTDQLDPTVVPSGITLSNNNLTATSTRNGWQSVRGKVSHTSGKYYAEATINALDGAVGFGVCNASQLTSMQIGGDTNGMSIFTTAGGGASGIEYNGGNAQAIGTAPAQGAVLGVAIDLNAKLIWFYNPATQQWNGDVVSRQNPATGQGGLPLTSIAVLNNQPNPVYLGVSVDAAGDALTINAGATAFVNSVPAGFNPWNTAS